MMKLPHTEEVDDDLFAAARVSSLMLPETYGRWRLLPFTRTEQEYGAEMLRLQFGEKQGERTEMEMARAVPPGDYISLQRRMTDLEARNVFNDQLPFTVEECAAELKVSEEKALAKYLPIERRWIPVMSDTPAEILEHWHPLKHARGKVAITGLGLGCLPHALLSLPDVTRIDIFDIDPDVIALTGPYLMHDERVHIWEASAADLATLTVVAKDAGGWDYAWHDIWTHISPRNLKDETAEHRISYGKLFEMYAPYAAQQQAWAYDQAQHMERIFQEEHKRELEFRRKLMALPFEEAVEVAYDQVVRGRLRGMVIPEDQPIPPQIIKVIDPEGGLKEACRKALSEPDIWERFSPDDAGDHTPLDTPNAHLETA